MASNETVEEIVNKVCSGDYGCARCGDLCDCPDADKIIASIASRFEAAHKREMEVLRRRLDAVVDSHKTTCGLCPSSEKIKELERRLKVAEDYIAKLAKIDTHPFFPDSTLAIIRHRAKEALAAIRGEGGGD